VVSTALIFLPFVARFYWIGSWRLRTEWKKVSRSFVSRGARFMPPVHAMESAWQTRPLMCCCTTKQTLVVRQWWNWRQTALMLMLLQVLFSSVMHVMAISLQPHRTYTFPDTTQGNRSSPPTIIRPPGTVVPDGLLFYP